MLSKTVLSFVSPGQVKMGRFLITRDESNNYLMLLDGAICALMMSELTAAKTRLCF
jgi:hypothetical protein